MLSVAEPSQLLSDPAAPPAIVVSRVKPVVGTPHKVLVEALLEQSPADLGWLAWQDGGEAFVVARDGTSTIQPSAIDEFPEHRRTPLTITETYSASAW